MQKAQPKKLIRKPHSQNRPGLTGKINFLHVFDHLHAAGWGKLKNKIALISAGDSGIGRDVAILFAEVAADTAIAT